MKGTPMPTLETDDGVELFYRDWGTGKPVVFCAGWTLSSAMWQAMMLPLTEAGYRCVAYDRRGHGRSDDPGSGYDYDTLADDLAALMGKLDLRDVCLVGHSMAGGELVRYVTRHGIDRLDRLVFIAPVPPKTLAAADNPDGFPAAAVAAVRQVWSADLGDWARAGAAGYFATQTPAGAVSRDVIDSTIRDMQRTSLQAAVECNKEIVASDFRAELSGLAVPVLYLHGELDVSFPIHLSSAAAVKLVPDSRMVTYPDAGHGLYVTHRDQLVREMRAFISNDAGG
jgi:pimeloyl-ACP methyl ester carboxylesterase